MKFIAIVFGCLAYVTGKQPGPLGIYTQSKSTIPTTEGQHDYLKTLAFDSDDTFYLEKDFICNDVPCPLIQYLPASGTYISRKSQSGNSNNTYHIKARSNEGYSFRYKVTYLKNSNKIRFSDGTNSYLLVKQNDKCEFGSKTDACHSNIGAYTVCASDNKCRIYGQLNTTCEEDHQCNTMYKCRSSFCRK